MAEAELSKKSIADLRYIAKMMGIKSPTTLKKSELIEKILAAGENSQDGSRVTAAGRKKGGAGPEDSGREKKQKENRQNEKSR
jgi:transcription termination factor Rho